MEKDEELEKVIVDAMAEFGENYVSALNKVIEFKKKNRGLKGLHISPSLDVFLGKGNVVDPKEEANLMAHDVLLMELSRARELYERFGAEELDRM